MEKKHFTKLVFLNASNIEKTIEICVAQWKLKILKGPSVVWSKMD